MINEGLSSQKLNNGLMRLNRFTLSSILIIILITIPTLVKKVGLHES